MFSLLPVYLQDFIEVIVFRLRDIAHAFIEKKERMLPLEILGVIFLVILGIQILHKIVRCCYYRCVKASLNRDILTKQKGRWAVVTGATDGIGKSYANALAAMDLNIVLISRDIKKLNQCAGEIAARHNVQTKVLAIDFTKDEEIYNEISRVLADLEIGVLVNNVGISYSYPEYFLELPDREKLLMALIRANVVSVTKMCEIVMPAMVARKSGIVINISSASALFPSPLLTVYAATKAYVEKFSDDLRYEYESRGLTIQTVLPGYVATKMAKIRKSSWFAPSPDRFVQSALGRLGLYDHTTGYFPHSLFVNFINFVERICKPLSVHLILKNMKATRQRSLAAIKRRAAESRGE